MQSKQESEIHHSRDSDACPLCGGMEWVYGVDSGGLEYAKPCECRNIAIMSRRLRFANIPSTFKDMTLKTFRADAYKKNESKTLITTACKTVKYYLDNFEQMKADGMGLYIFSDTKGSGKTRMAVSIANELMQKYPVKFSTSLAILNEIKRSWNKDSEYTENKLLDDLCNTEILIIDDFGTEMVTGWINDKFYFIINHRYMNQKVTLFTSNSHLDRLEYDNRITNRIKERTFQIAFPEESVRNHIADKNNIDMIERIRQ